MKCANCTLDASYEYYVTPGFSQFFCGRHLPGFTKAPKYAGRLSKVVPAVQEEPAVETKKKKTSKAVAEPVVEEPIVEDVVVETAPTEVAEEPTEVVEGE